MREASRCKWQRDLIFQRRILSISSKENTSAVSRHA